MGSDPDFSVRLVGVNSGTGIQSTEPRDVGVAAVDTPVVVLNGARQPQGLAGAAADDDPLPPLLHVHHIFFVHLCIAFPDTAVLCLSVIK